MLHRIFSLCLLFIISITCIEVYAEDTPWTKANVVHSINAFGGNLLDGLYKTATTDENILVSPVNGFTALALLHLGAGEGTRNDLASVMKLTEYVKNSSEVLHQQLQATLSKLVTQADEFGRFHETVFANGIFVQKDFPIEDAYLKSAKQYYESLAQNVDFKVKQQEATDIINNWISNSTRGRIPKFYDSPIDSDTISVLTSALYFNAQWRGEFWPEKTKNEKFKTGSAEIDVPMMRSEHSELEYVHDDKLHYDSVSLPYAGKEYEMNIYLQHANHENSRSLAQLFHELAEQNFDSKISTRLVDLKLPKMKFAWKKSIVNALNLQTIFSGSPDLSVMCRTKELKISNMIHATELEVDEKGTIATAVTALELVPAMAVMPLEGEPIKFYVNRPFLVTIMHRDTKTVLFAGIVRKPI